MSQFVLGDKFHESAQWPTNKLHSQMAPNNDGRSMACSPGVINTENDGHVTKGFALCPPRHVWPRNTMANDILGTVRVVWI